MKNEKRNNKADHSIMRKAWGAKIDTQLIDELKHLSVDMNTHAYLLAEEALRMFIKHQRAILEKKKKVSNF